MFGHKSMKKFIVIIVAGLLLLTGCAADTGAILPTEGSMDSTAVSGETMDVSTEAGKENAGAVLLQPVTYQVDLSRDELPEVLTVRENREGDEYRTEITLVQDGVTLWMEDLELENGLTKKAYFLITIEEEMFLALYRAYLAEGSYRYTLEVFDLEGGAIRHVDNQTIRFGAATTDGDPIDGESLGKFSKWINWYLSRGILLCLNDRENYSYSTPESQNQYRETFADVFTPAKEYADCTTVEEMAERYNSRYNLSDDDETDMATAPENFAEIATEMLAENRNHLSLGVELSEDRSFWYREYNDWAIQVIRDDPTYSTPILTTDVVYYYVRDEKTTEEIAALMLEVLIAEAKVKSPDRDYVVTDFRIPKQTLIDEEKAWNLCLEDWYAAEPKVQSNVRAFVRDWLLYNAEDAGFLPIGEEMWYFVPEGWFSYTGTCDGLTLSEAMAAAPEAVVGDKIPLISEECDEPVVLVLMKQGNVYRLQSVAGMQKTYEKLLNAEETTQAEVEEE